jgi:hypothetical protein
MATERRNTQGRTEESLGGVGEAGESEGAFMNLAKEGRRRTRGRRMKTTGRRGKSTVGGSGIV